jgi:hypothetical protein
LRGRVSHDGSPAVLERKEWQDVIPLYTSLQQAAAAATFSLKEVIMSAPDTIIKKQKKRHKPAIWGLWLSLAVVVIAAISATVYFS